jgi:hypothetical protein
MMRLSKLVTSLALSKRSTERAAAAVLAATAALATAAPATASARSTQANLPDEESVVSPIALGLNTAAWDGLYTNAQAAQLLNTDIKAAHIGLLRYPGGSWADDYDWSTNTDIFGCITKSEYGNPCPETDSLDFDAFSANARAAGAQTFVTVNYGSGTPAEAAGWVQHSLSNPTDRVALWEVGNENYGCWETNQWLADYPTYFQGYVPNDYSTCPNTVEGNAQGTLTLAQSYAANALPFILAMKSVDPQASIGVPWAFGSQVAGAQVADASEWNDTVLGADGRLVDFVDAHYYPFGFSGGLPAGYTDQTILSALEQIPSLYQQIRQTLNTYDPQAAVVVGETNISNNETSLDCQPLSALFAAGDALEWLSAGALSVDWWDMNNYGSCPSGIDYGMFTSNSPNPTPLPPYYGYQLASLLTTPGARLSALNSGVGGVLEFGSRMSGGEAIAFINTNSAQTQVSLPVGRWPAGAQIWTYSVANPQITQASLPATQQPGLMLPAESIVVVTTSSPTR